MHGHDLYPTWTAGDIYGLLYGPIIFLINGAALLLSPTIFGSKLTGILSVGVVLGTTLIISKQKTDSNLTSLIMLASQVMLFVSFGQSTYWNRPEPFLKDAEHDHTTQDIGQQSPILLLGAWVLGGFGRQFV